MSVTVREIARVAEVSPATVSRALTRPETVAEGTRTRVLEVAERLGYQRAIDRGEPLKLSNGVIGIVVPDLLNPTFTAMVKESQHRLHLRGYELMLADTERNADAELELAGSMLPHVDGLVVCSALSEHADLAELASQKPLLLIDSAVPGVPTISVEYADGMQQAVAHLVALGHQRIAYAGGRLTTWSETERREGLRRAVEAHALPDFLDLGHYLASVGGGYAAADQLLATDATAIVCINTFVALGLVHRLNQRGVAVPSRMSVVQFDAGGNSHLVSPMLTTVAPPDGAVGRVAAEAIVRMVNDRPSGVETIRVDLSIRQSTTFARDARVASD